MTTFRNPRRFVTLVVLALAATLAAARLTAAGTPSLVVVISVDQMRADYLDRFRPYFGKDGFNRFLERGAVFTQAHHRHSYAETAPGHASIGTGLDPRHHGILSNHWFDPMTGKNPYSAADRAGSVAARYQTLYKDPNVTRFLLETGRIYNRRKEDVHTRRETDNSPTKMFLNTLRKSMEGALKLINEYEAWAKANNVQIEKRRD